MSVHKQDVLDLLNSLKAVRDSFAVVRVRHIAETSTVARRLFIEGAVNYMSPEEMAQASGYTPKAVRMYLREHGLDPRMKKPMLSKHAARVLADNAALLNLEPTDLLLSPLAYLPAGDALRREVQEKNLSKVTEVEPDPSTPFAERRCQCKVPVSSGSLNGGAEVCMWCTYILVDAR